MTETATQNVSQTSVVIGSAILSKEEAVRFLKELLDLEVSRLTTASYTPQGGVVAVTLRGSHMAKDLFRESVYSGLLSKWGWKDKFVLA